MAADMNEFILSNEPLIRLGFFIGILTAVAMWKFAPSRPRPIMRP
jgi:hypothetical protein